MSPINDKQRNARNSGMSETAAKGICFKNKFLSLPLRPCRRYGLPAVLLLLTTLSVAWAKYEREQLAMESQLTQRIESILSRTLPANSYLVTVKVEMMQSGGGVERRSTTRGGDNPFLKENRFVLPGVP